MTITLARDMTALGNDATLWVVAVLVAGYLAAGRQWLPFAHLVAASALDGTTTSAIKAIVDPPARAWWRDWSKSIRRAFPAVTL